MSDKPLNILIVEDDSAHQTLLTYHLNRAFPGVELSVTTTLSEARKSIASVCPDMVLIDLNLPDGLGVELLIESVSHARFPVVIMTGQGGEQLAVEAIKRGAIDYVVKSEATYADIQHMVERALRDWHNLCARKKAEEELRHSEGKYRRLTQEFQAILEGINSSISLVDPQMRLIWANRIAIEASASGKNWQPGINCYDLWQGRCEVCTDCPVVKTFATALPAEEIKEYQDGRIWDVHSFPLLNTDGSVANVIILANDVSEEMQLRAETMRSSQLSALGEMAAGVAHEINNPLNGVINYAQLLLDKSVHEEERSLSQSIIDESNRIAKIVSSLLTFSRKPQCEPHSMSMADALHGVLKLTEVKLRQDNIILEMDIEPELPLIDGHYQTLQQVLLNILNNANYALNQKYSGFDPKKRLIIDMHRHESEGHSWLRTMITDFGGGIPLEKIDKVCDPFFTTKPQGSGTGLGMSISHGIVKNHGGRLLLSSKPGTWTKVIIDLPLN